MGQQAKVEHAEFVSKDPVATQKFLEKAFDLKFTDTGPEMGNYRIHGPQEGATTATMGIRTPMGPEGTGTIAYLTVPNIDEAIKRVTSAGARIVQPKTEIPKMGYMAIYLAPGDVLQGIYQAMGR